MWEIEPEFLKNWKLEYQLNRIMSFQSKQV